MPFVPSGVPILVAAAVAAAIGWFTHTSVPAGMAPDIEPYDEPYAEHDGSHTLVESERRPTGQDGGPADGADGKEAP